MKKPAKVIGGTFTIAWGVVTSDPIRYNASQKTIDRWWARLSYENNLVQSERAKWVAAGMPK